MTNGVRQALRAELERRQAAQTAKNNNPQELLERFNGLQWQEGVSGKETQDALYDDQGLPV